MSEIKVISISNQDGMRTTMIANGVRLYVVDVFGSTQVWVDEECFYEKDWTPAMWDCVRIFRKMLEDMKANKRRAQDEKRKAILARLK